MKRLLVTYFLFISSIYCFSQTYQDYMTTGLDAYARSDWSSAIFSFQKAIEISSNSSDEATYWRIMTNASAKNYKQAIAEISKFLKQFPNSPKVKELIYQQGRLFCLIGHHEKSINVLYGFLRRYPNHRQVPSAYYWIGQNLYLSGRLKDARTIFSRVIIDYPASAKVEPSRYKIALIDQSSTQNELLKLLKISHEELLKLSEDYGKAKKNYEQTIIAYQKKAVDVNKDSRMAEFAEKLYLEQKRNEELYDKVVMLELKNQELTALLSKLDPNYESRLNGKISADPDYSTESKKRESLEALREKAKQLQNMYDQLLKGEKNEEKN